MSQKCIVTGKTPMFGHNVSHSNVHTRKKFQPNIHKRRLKNPADGRMVTVFISSAGLRTLKKWDREGKPYDLREMTKDAERKDG